MEVKEIKKDRRMKIDTEDGAVLLTYIIKVKMVINGKELEIIKTLTQQLIFDYDSEEATKQLASIEHEIYELERKADKWINDTKEILIGLEQIAENHGYKII